MGRFTACFPCSTCASGWSWLVTAVLVTCAFPGPGVRAATITLKSGCSLVQAINGANGDSQVGTCAAASGADTIVLVDDVDVTSVNNTVSRLGGNGLPVITTDITVRGDGYTIRRVSSDPFRLFFVGGTGRLTLRQTVVENGQADTIGGCIYVTEGGYLALDRSVVRLCEAHRSAGINNKGRLLIEESYIADNLASGPTGENTYGAGLSSFGGDLTVRGSTFYGNWVLNASGDSSPDGGAMRIVGGTAMIENSTFSSNLVAGNGGAIAVNDLWFIPPSPTVDIKHSTFMGNLAGTSGASIDRTGGTVTLTANIVSGDGSGCDGSFLDGGDNLGCLGGPTVTGVSGTLADNGGPTPTHALLAVSNAITAAIPCHADLDQRRFVRDENCDSGAYEYTDCEEIQLEDDTILGPRTYEASCSLSVGPNWIVAPGGNVTLRAGRRVVLNNGSGVEIVGRLIVELDPGLLVP